LTAGDVGRFDHDYAYQFGRLGYRTVFWERQDGDGDYQGNAVMNYPGAEVPFTRKVEHKHFTPWEQHDRTVVFTENSKDTEAGDTRFYPKGLSGDRALLGYYLKQTQEETRVSFLGRLATYRHLDMHQVVAEAIDFAPRLAEAIRVGSPRPILPKF
jgi:UDP-galactopyranose mutase